MQIKNKTILKIFKNLHIVYLFILYLNEEYF